MRLTIVVLAALLGSAILSASGWVPSAAHTHPALPRPARWAVERNLPSANVLKPGIYETALYTSIVIVPRRHVDDGIIVRPREPVPSMPIITVRPELRFIPWSPRK